MAFTAGFASPTLLTLHFVKHGAEFGAATEADYLNMADTFVGGAKPAGVLQCTRASNNDRVRFRLATQWFGVLKASNHIKTFYIPKPPPRNAKWFKNQCAM